MNRAAFLSGLIGIKPDISPVVKPIGGLESYTGPWTQTEVSHLLRRLTFGAKLTDVNALLKLSTDAAVDKLLVQDPLPYPPLNVYSSAQSPDPDVPSGKTFVNAPLNLTLPPTYYQARTDAMKAWWVGNMIDQKTNISEKITLFWHNHFAVEADQVQLAQWMYSYLQILRNNSLGNFQKMTKEISISLAMLKYLNGEKNSKNAPDENYGRELQELFTIGKGPDSKYTESDVKEAAKILSGHTINYTINPNGTYGFEYKFNFLNHDSSTKRFSAFYNNTAIAGRAFAQGADELDDLITMIFSNIETARHLCRKFYQFFVYYEITPDVETNIIIPLADQFKSNGYDIKKTLKILFNSAHFFDQANINCILKSPMDYAVGLSREFSITFPDNTNLLNQYLGWGGITSLAAYQGLNIGDPPLVAGWQAWYQSPQFQEIWINADTLANRNRLAENINSSKGIDFNGVILKIDPVVFTAQLKNPSSAIELVKEATLHLYNLSLSNTALNYFKTFLITGYPDDSYWTQAWLDYSANPNDAAAKSAVSTRLSALYREILGQAEYHLC